MVIINKKCRVALFDILFMNTQFRYWHFLSSYYQRYRKSWCVCVTRNFWLKHFKKLGKIVTWFADKGFWQYSTTPSNKFTLSLLTFRNLLEILWSCRSTFYKERYVYNYNSLVPSLRTFKRSSFECMGNLAFLVEISKPLTIFGIRKL